MDVAVGEANPSLYNGQIEQARQRIFKMVYAFSTDDNVLHVFPNAEAAIAYCEGYDVAGGLWRFLG